MKKFLVAILSSVFLITSCSNYLKSMEEKFEEFKDNADEYGYILKFNSLESTSYNRFDIDVNPDKTYILIIETENAVGKFHCGDENSYKAEIDGDVYVDSPEMVKNTCEVGDFLNQFSHTMDEVYSSGFFDDEYDVDYEKRDGYYIAYGSYEGSDEYELKISTDGTEFEYKDSKKEVKIEVKK